MRRYVVLIASCFVFGSQLDADPIPTFIATSATASVTAGEVSFSIAGASFDMTGSARTSATPYFGLPPGVPLSSRGLNGFALIETLGPPIKPSGTITIGGMAEFVEYAGLGIVMSGDAIIPSSSAIFTLPATLTGTYRACPFNLSDTFPCAGVEMELADISINLPGEATFVFTTPRPPLVGLIDLSSITFTSIPEPSTTLLSLVGAISLVIALVVRSRSSFLH